MRRFTLLLPLLFIAQASAEDGERLFNRVCAACHQAGARGIPHSYPELREHLACLARQTGGREYVVGVVNYGLEGEIAVEGDRFDGYMPAATSLSSAEKASVLNYVLSLSERCQGPEPPITQSEVESAIGDKKWTPETLRALRGRLTPSTSGRGTGVVPAQIINVGRAAHDFNLFCRGCHTERGEAVPGLVPPLKGNVALFLQTERGRAFVSQVPGVAFAPLNDERLAEVLNWVAESFSTSGVPNPNYRYTAAEVGSYRREPLTDVKAMRAQVIAELRNAGFDSPH